jgi:uncharacterized protein YprB with RNaseH-like and TPR domain
MINLTALQQTFSHAPGIGPATEAKIKAKGYAHWQSVLEKPDDLPLGAKTSSSLCEILTRSQSALQQDDIQFFIDHLATKEQWRILATYFDRLSYFDIETSGLSYDAYVTCVACYHRGKVYTYINGENLDDFLDLLEEVDLLVSFNGSSFDVPFMLRTYHIPEFPCPHIDLRWQCYHQEHRGGLKQIEHTLNIMRPDDLQGVDGAEAVWLWFRWKQYQDQKARERLLRYCGADVLTLQLVTASLLKTLDVSVETPEHKVLWALLDEAPDTTNIT